MKTIVGLSLITAASVAAAQGSPVNHPLFACYEPSSGAVYMIKLPSTPLGCAKSDDVEFSWNVGGSVGDEGPAGDVGAAGAAGVRGQPGDIGAAGIEGPKGALGDVGPRGPAGVAGARGIRGPRGPLGPVGAVGAKGPKGPPGIPGAVGDSGLKGLRGVAGPVGAPGPMGAPGARGAMGPSGDDAGYQIRIVQKTFDISYGKIVIINLQVVVKGRVACDAGEIAIGGGWRTNGALLRVMDSFREDEGWSVRMTSENEDGNTFTVFAICAKTSV